MNGQIVSEVRLGALSGTIWANKGDDGKERLSVTLKRSYRQPSGDWGEVKMSIPSYQLLEAAELLRQMYWDAWEHTRAQKESGTATEVATESADVPF